MQNNDANVIIRDTNNDVIGYGHFHIDLSATNLSFELVYTSHVHQVIIDNSGSEVTYDMITGGDKHFIQDTITISSTFTISNISIRTYQTDGISHIDSQPVLITENATGNGNAVPSSDLSGTHANGCVVYADLSSNNSTLTCSVGLNLLAGALPYSFSLTNKNKKVTYGTPQSVNNSGIYTDISFNLTAKDMATIFDDNNTFYFNILDGSTNKLTLPLTDIEFPLPAPGTYHDGYVQIDNSGVTIGYGHFYHFIDHGMPFNSYEIVFTQDISSVTIQDAADNSILATYTDLSGKYYIQDSVLDSSVAFKVISVLPNGTSITSNVADLTEVNSSGNGNGLPLNPDPAATLYPNGCVVYAEYVYPTLTYSFGTKLPPPSISYEAKFLRAANQNTQYGSNITVTNNSISDSLTLTLNDAEIAEINADANLLFCVFDGSTNVVTLQMTDIDFSVVPTTTTIAPATTTTIAPETTTTIAPATTTTIAPETTTTIAPATTIAPVTEKSSGYSIISNGGNQATVIYYYSVNTVLHMWVTQIGGQSSEEIAVVYNNTFTQLYNTIPNNSIANTQTLGTINYVKLGNDDLTSVPAGAGGGGYGGLFGYPGVTGVTCFVQNETYPNIIVYAAYTIDVSNQYVALTNSTGNTLFSNRLLITNSVKNTMQTHTLTRSSVAQGLNDIYYTIFGSSGNNITFQINNLILEPPVISGYAAIPSANSTDLSGAVLYFTRTSSTDTTYWLTRLSLFTITVAYTYTNDISGSFTLSSLNNTYTYRHIVTTQDSQDISSVTINGIPATLSQIMGDGGGGDFSGVGQIGYGATMYALVNDENKTIAVTAAYNLDGTQPYSAAITDASGLLLTDKINLSAISSYKAIHTDTFTRSLVSHTVGAPVYYTIYSETSTYKNFVINNIVLPLPSAAPTPLTSGYLVTTESIIYYNTSSINNAINMWVTNISGGSIDMTVYHDTSFNQYNINSNSSISDSKTLGTTYSIILAGENLLTVPTDAGGGGFGGLLEDATTTGVTCFAANSLTQNGYVNVRAAYTVDLSGKYVALTDASGTTLFSDILNQTQPLTNTIQELNFQRTYNNQGSESVYYTIFDTNNTTSIYRSFMINDLQLVDMFAPTTAPQTTVPPTTTTVPPTTTLSPTTTLPPTTMASLTLSRGYVELNTGSLIGAAILNLNIGKPSTVSLAYNCSTDISSVTFTLMQNGNDLHADYVFTQKNLAIDVSLNSFEINPGYTTIYTIRTSVINLSGIINFQSFKFFFQGVAGYNIGAGFKSSASPGGVVVATFVPSGSGLALSVTVTFMELYGSGNITVNTIIIYFQNTAQTETVGFPTTTFTTLGSGTVTFTTSVLTSGQIAAFVANEMFCYIDDQNDESNLHLLTMLVEGLSATPPTPVICFKEGSKILTSTGYVRVEHLVEGHLVQTFKHGLLPIQALGMSRVYNTGKKGKRDMDALYVYRAQRGGGAFADLVVTGKHSALVDSLSPMQKSLMTAHFGSAKQTDGKYHLLACVDARADPYDGRGFFSVYHLALGHRVNNGNGGEDGHYGIYANGLLMESCSLAHIQGMAVKLF